jgi:hypothetical protein
MNNVGKILVEVRNFDSGVKYVGSRGMLSMAAEPPSG